MNPDLEWALGAHSLFARNGDGEEEVLHYLVVHGEPWSKQRAKFDTKRGRTYQPGDDAKAEKRMRHFLQSRSLPMIPGNAFLACLFYRSNQQRIDADNMLKHVCDSANGVLWEDDSQVTCTFAEVMLDRDDPRTVIVIGRHWSSLNRGDDRLIPCAHCEKPYLPTSGQKTRFCSRECSQGARATRLDSRECPVCHVTFAPFTRTQIACSKECATVSMTNRAKRARRPFSRCSTCDRELTHHRGGRCRECWRADPGYYPPKQEVLA